MLDGVQAGLSWITILKKREAFRAAFDNFDPEKVARYGEADRARLMADAGIIRSNGKIDAAISGARIYLDLRERGEDASRAALGLCRRQAGAERLRATGPGASPDPLRRRHLQGPKSKEQVRRPVVFVYALTCRPSESANDIGPAATGMTRSGALGECGAYKGVDLSFLALIVRLMPYLSADMPRLFQALADPTRLAVVAQLAQGPSSMTALARPFDMALPSFSQHLKVLEDCGMVRSSKSGRVRTYELQPKALEAAEHWLAAHRRRWETRLDQLDDYLKTLKETP